jgi:hypothetical protein
MRQPNSAADKQHGSAKLDQDEIGPAIELSAGSADLG